ncbi:hypothetical protein phytr_6460 [Candidatus Phycorickettsia trachydisci]|uniref:Uncharacterized protein n=1 Tax=Candidatus Phycorickettsia trachydisci TaxID=2115978 RepID=A0A2P1P8K3_9RICK|nr:ankyrin repeat domain-containing protein [Candidatus Phycorickettsia trachydisci]AVP87587.1 hypothetical protein phytr_6460 [Candidatus Phycorickettsia trachydisci]
MNKKNPELFQALHRPELGLKEMIEKDSKLDYNSEFYTSDYMASLKLPSYCNIMHVAASIGNPKSLSIIVERLKDAKVIELMNSRIFNQKSYHKESVLGNSTPLMAAVINGHDEVAKMLIDMGAHVHYKEDKQSLSPLETALTYAANIKMLEVLTRGINDKILYSSLLNISVEYCDVEGINFLLDKGAVVTADSLNLILRRPLNASQEGFNAMRNGVKELLTLLNSGVVIQEDNFRKLESKIDVLYQPRLITEDGLCPIVCLGGMMRIFKFAGQFRSENVKSAIKNYIFDAGLNDLVHEKVERVKQSKDPLEIKQFLKSINTLLKNISENLSIFEELKESYLQLHEKASDILFSHLEEINSNPKDLGFHKELADTLKRTAELYERDELRDNPDLLEKLSDNLEVLQKRILDHLPEQKDANIQQDTTTSISEENWLVNYVKNIFHPKTSDVSSKDVTIEDSSAKREIMKCLPLDQQGRLGNLCKDGINAPWLPESSGEGDAVPSNG